MNKFIGIIAGLTAASLAAPAASQEQGKTVPCLKAVKHLGKKYSEIPVAIGPTNNGAVLEVLSSNSGKNWTIMVTLPNGTACMIGRDKTGKNSRLRRFSAPRPAPESNGTYLT